MSRAKATSIRAWLEGAGHRQVRVEAAYFMTLQYTLTSSGTCPRRSRLGGVGTSSGSETQAASHAGCEEGTCPADGTAPSRTGLQGPALRGRGAGGRPWRPGRGVCGAGRGDTGCAASAPRGPAPRSACTAGGGRWVAPPQAPAASSRSRVPFGQAFNSALTSLVVFASFDTRPCRFPVTLNSVSPLTLPACLSVGQPLGTASVICFFLLEVPRGRQVTPHRVLPAAGAGLCSCLPGAVLSGRSHPLPPSSVPGLPSPGASRPRKPRPHPPA